MLEDPGLIVTIVTGIFAAGLTWGIMKAGQKANAEKVEQNAKDLKDVVTELRGIATELRGIATELQVMKASNSRNERDIASHDERISALEIAVAKLQPRQ